jgi:hypothetical protein
VKLWNDYLQLVQVEEAFRTFKSDQAIRPIFHQSPAPIEAHLFIASWPTACMSRWSGNSNRSHPG